MMSITPESLLSVWGVIRAKIPDADPGTLLEQALSIHGEIGLSAVVRVSDTMPGIVIRVPCRWPTSAWQVLRLTGVRFEPIITDHDDLLLPVILADDDAVAVFAVFTADLASVLSGDGAMEAKMRLLIEKVSLWKRFFQRNRGSLSDEEVRGLIGELQILGMMVGAYGVDAALDSWKGPDGELHDFRNDVFRIEVKTWINKSLPRIFISDPSQIVVDPSWPVFIAAVQLANDNAAGFTVEEYIATLVANMAEPQRAIMEALLADAGYLHAHAELYSKRYAVRETVFYKIGDGFPLIDPATLPGGITCLKYALELGALTPFTIKSPTHN
jgi:hypothetical protein